jgi:trimeric autotransporter adhesin
MQLTFARPPISLSCRQAAPAVLVSLFVALSIAGAQTPADTHWDGRFGYVYSAGLGFANNDRLVLYVNEPCLDADGAVLNCNIASWDGTALRLEAPGHFLGTVRTITIGMSGNDVYFGGDFTSLDGNTFNRIAVWQGSEWQPLGEGLNDQVAALRAHETGLYAGGWFTEAGGAAANYVAVWNGVSWQPVIDAFEANGVNGQVRAITSSPGSVWFAGNLTAAGGVTGTTRIAKWDIGTHTWHKLGEGLFGQFALDLEHAAGQLIAISNDLLGPRAFDFQNETWNTIPSPMPASIIDAHIANSGLVYARGNFSALAGPTAGSFAVWNGTAWEAVGAGASDARNFITGVGEDVYVGLLNLSDGGRTHGVGWWDGTEWKALGHGLGSTVNHPPAGTTPVHAMVRSGEHLYVAGTFRWAGTAAANGVARWNGSRWTPLGGPDALIDFRALAPAAAGVIAGGLFTSIDGTAMNGIARWEDGAWHALGDGVSGGNPFYGAGVHALYREGNDVYVGGSFTSAGGLAATQVARWDGSGWHALGSGLAQTGVVNAIIRYDGKLFVGGQFQQLGDGTPTQSVAYWDGTSWRPAGAGIGSGYVRAFAERGGDLFAIHDGHPAAVLRWTGSAWEQVAVFTHDGGVFFQPRLYSLFANGSDLYVGGDFTHVNGQRSWRIAKWDGSEWSNLGSGVWRGRGVALEGGVYAFAGSEDGLWVGGNFLAAGNTPSNNIALWRNFQWVPTSAEPEVEVPVRSALHQNYPNPFNAYTTVPFAVPQQAHVVLKVYDLLGRTVATLVDGQLPAGHHTARFDASGLPSGTYLYVMEAGDFREVRRMVLVK